MITRREFATGIAAAAAIAGAGRIGPAAAQAKLSEADLLRFDAKGKLTILHITDLHAQLVPLYFREPSLNLGVGEVKGLTPHFSGAEFLKHYAVLAGSADAYALTDIDFANLARAYGRMGGLDRVATLVNAIRAERGAGNVMLLDGGDTWTNSWGSLKTEAQDVVDCMALLKPDAMVAHWEFTLGAERVMKLVETLGFPMLGQNIRDTEFEDRVFPPRKMFERGGAKVAVIGQSFPFTAISNPRWMFPKWQFGLRENDLRKEVDAARASGADVVVLLSHNGFDVDRKVAQRIDGIDVILTAHTHDALPTVTKVRNTLLIASGSSGKFLSRLDLDIADKRIRDFSYRLIPVFSDAITPDPTMAALIAKHRAPFATDLARVVGRTDTLLYRRGTLAGTLDDVITDAILEQRDVEIALSPGVRWGNSLLPGQDITFEDIANATAMTYANCYRMEMTGARLKVVLEDVSDNIFNPDPYYQSGGDMVRTGGLGFEIAPDGAIGNRISKLVHLKSGSPIDPAKTYTVGGWASVNEGTQGPPIWDIVTKHIEAKKIVAPLGNTAVRIAG